ncbi:MAG: preprotein translocase subunit YajC, partial [Candidatus Azotimanducaceae bacterium]
LLQFPIEVGVLGSVTLALLFLSSIFMAIRSQMKRRHRFFRAMGFSALMAMIAIAIHSSSDFNLQIFANAATFVCILAMPWLAMYLPGRRARSGANDPV